MAGDASDALDLQHLLRRHPPLVGDELRAQAEDLLGIERAEVEDEVQTGGVSPGIQTTT
jgi:hypothetical protein